MKKIIVFLLVIIMPCIVLIACSNDTNNSVDSSAIISEKPQENNDEAQAEERASELFTDLIESLELNIMFDGGKELEDLAKKYPNNVAINNYYNFNTATFWLSVVSEFSSNDENYIRFEESLSLVDLSYSDEHSEYIINFVESNMGIERYEALSGNSVAQKDNFDSFTYEQKLEIVFTLLKNEDDYGESYTEEKADEVWKDICSEFNITESQLSSLLGNEELLTEAYSMLAPSNEVLEYDARLDFDGEPIVVAATEEDLNIYIDAIINNDNDKLQELETSLRISYVSVGTKVNIIEKNLTTANVEILEGLYQGNSAWVLIESISE